MTALHDLYQYESELDAEIEAGEQRRRALHSGNFGKPIKRSTALHKAKEIAADALRLATSPAPLADRREQLGDLCGLMGVDYPESKFGHAPEVARLSAVEWWGRKLRVSDWRQFEERKIRVGQIERYCSDEIASAYVHHQHDIATLLDGLIAFRDDGAAAASLLEMAQKSKANPAVRFAAMIHKLKGGAGVAYDAGMTWAFFTLTCPSKYHRMTTTSDKRKVPNPKWNGALPRDGQEYLVKLWARFRAKLKREKFDWKFWRVVEPHTDGTPHWHGIIWAKPDDLKKIGALLREFAFQEDGKEPGAWKHRMHWKKYRPWAAKNVEGDARTKAIDACIGYLVAYIGKNVHGKRADGTSIGTTLDRYGREVPGDAIDNAVRVVAWASLWGIHQFQFGGFEKSGPYEELRRLRKAPDNMLADAWAAADAADFAAYSNEARQLGLQLIVETSKDRLQKTADDIGVDVGRLFDPGADLTDPDIAREREALAAAAIEAEIFNKWGEPARRWIRGVSDAAGMAEVDTRPHSWRVGTLDDVKAIAATMGQAGRRLLDLLRERTDAIQRAAGESVALLLCALQRPAEPGALGPGSITVRDSGQGLATAGPDPGSTDDDEAAAWYFVDHSGIEQAAF